jgi:HSP20 family protein
MDYTHYIRSINKGGKSVARQRNQEQSQAVEPQRGQQASRMESRPMLSPFSMMRRFATEMDRIFDRMWEGNNFPMMERFGQWGSTSFTPDIDIFERDGKLVIRADLPGMSKDDVKVDLSEDSVIIDGERKYEHEEQKEGIYRTECSYGRFHREIPLPQGVKADTANANFRNGVLEITMEAPQASKSRRRIDIQGEGSQQGQSAA